MSGTRWPVLILVPALLVGGFLVDRRSRPEPQAPSVGALVEVVQSPTVEPESSDSATWFCAAGALDDEGSFRVRAVNTTGEVRRSEITAFAAAGAGGGIPPAPVVDELIIEPYSEAQIDLETILGRWPYAAASVEVDGGGVVVEQLVDGRAGSDAQPCVSRASSSWYLPTGSTVLGASYDLVLFNPFPESAVVDLLATTENGVRQSDFTGEVVPGRSLLVVDLGASIQVADQIALSIEARSGRLVAGLVQVFDPARPSAPPTRGLSAGLATPGPSELSYIPNMAAGDRLVVHNPSATEQAEVDVIILTDEANDAIEPFELTIFPNQQEIVDFVDPERLGGAERFTVVVQSFNGVAVVAGRRSLVLPAEDDDSGSIAAVEQAPEMATLIASPEAASTLVLDVSATQLDPQESRVTLVNPSFDTISEVTIAIVVDGRLEEAALVVELQPGGRRSLPLAELGVDGEFTLLLEASAPIIAQRDLVSFGLQSRSAALAVPVAGTVEPLEPVTFGG